MDWNVLITLVLIFIITIVLILIYHGQVNPPTPPGSPSLDPLQPPAAPLAPAGGSIINCAELGVQVTGPNCGSGTQSYGGVCYTDVWSQAGGEKTAVCTVDWGSYGGVYTQCGIGIYYLNYGDPCPMVGPGYYKTAVCTCQLKGVVTADQYCQDQGFPNTCPTNSDNVAGYCYSSQCPAGYTRSGRCTCAPA